MKKLVFVACAAMIAVMAHASFVAAQGNGDGIMTLSPADFGISRPGILPTSNLYFFKELQRSIQRAFAFGAESEAKLEMKFANEKAAEILKLKELGVWEGRVIERALEGYAKAQERVSKELEKVKHGKESASRKDVLERAEEQGEKHSKFLRELAGTMKDNEKAQESILRAEKVVKGATEEMLEKAAEEIRRAQELIEEVEMLLVEEEIAAWEQACLGNVAIGCFAPEISECRDGKWVCVGPAQAQQVSEGGLGLEQSGHLLAQAREHVSRAMDAFDEEKYGEAYGQARAAVATATNAKRMTEEQEGSDELEEENEKKNEESERSGETRRDGCICAEVYSPVCGKDSKTYGNACEATCADEDIVYAGECTANAVSRSEEKMEKKTVEIENFIFSPKEMTVKKGTTITWVNKDTAPHQIASNPHPLHTSLPELSSGVLAQGQSYSFTFQKVGTVGYHCNLHPSMQGKITVIE